MTNVAEPLAAELVGSGYDEKTLSKCIQLCLLALADRPITHAKQIDETRRSIRVFGQKPFPGSGQYPSSTPAQLARELLTFGEKGGALYPENEPLHAVKGWKIERTIDDANNVLVLASATWMLPE